MSTPICWGCNQLAAQHQSGLCNGCHVKSAGHVVEYRPMAGTITDEYTRAMQQLTRSIDGLRGSVDKLTEAIEPDVVTTTMSREEAQRAKNKLFMHQVDMLAVKRGPVTDAEAEAAQDYWVMLCQSPAHTFTPGPVIWHAMLDQFARSRGLL